MTSDSVMTAKRCEKEQTNQIVSLCVCVGQTPVRPPQKRVGGGNRRILGDRNTTTTVTSSSSEDTFLSHIDSSLSSAAGSYTDFHVSHSLYVDIGIAIMHDAL